MNKLALNGEWATKMELTHLSSLNNAKFFRHERDKQHVTELEKGLINITFWDEQNLDPDPSGEQNATVDLFFKTNM